MNIIKRKVSDVKEHGSALVGAVAITFGLSWFAIGIISEALPAIGRGVAQIIVSQCGDIQALVSPDYYKGLIVQKGSFSACYVRGMIDSPKNPRKG